MTAPSNESRPSSPRRTLGIAAAVCAWSALVGLSMGTLYFHGSAASRTRAPVVGWPAATTLRRVTGLPTLVMAAHPLCPCTRASLGELNVIMNRAHGRVKAYALFIQPSGVDDDWSSDSTRRAAEIPDLESIIDTDGAESSRFHLSVSGEMALFDAEGRLVFHGGITSSRGHAGDNGGRALVSAWLEDHHAPGDSHPVFGCALDESEARNLPVELPRALTRSALLERSGSLFCGACHTVGSSARPSLAAVTLR